MVYRNVRPENIMIDTKEEGINGLLKMVHFDKSYYLDDIEEV